MENAVGKDVGYLIKKYRQDQNMSQERLCNGICAVSYLSKIESGLVCASQDIITSLFNVLGIHYCTDTVLISEGKELMDEYFKSYFFSYHEECSRLFETLYAKEAIYLFSPLMLDYLLVKCYDTCFKNYDLALELTHEIGRFSNYLTPLQHYFLLHIKTTLYLYCTKNYSLALETIQKAHNYHKNSVSHYLLSNCYFNLGDYSHAIDTNEEAFTLAINEGNILCALEICLLQASIHNHMKNTHLMIKYYERALNLSEGLGDIRYKQRIYYDLGSTYLTLKNYSLALPYLLKSSALAQMNHSYPPTLYHNLALAYLESKDFQKCKSYLDLAYTNLSTDSSSLPFLRQMLDLLSIRLTNKAYIFDTNYLNQLEQIYNAMCCSLDSTLKHLYGDYLISCYKSNRKYKDALRITEELYVKSYI